MIQTEAGIFMADGKKKNPFTISFGRPPVEYINRKSEYDRIFNTFTEKPVTDQIFIITGVRGSGKTVLFSSVLKALRSKNDWIIIQLNTYDDMVEAFYSELYYAMKSHRVKLSAEFNVPHAGITVSVNSDAPERTVKSKIEELLRLAEGHRKNILVAVDEVSKSTEMKRFAKVFQEMIGNELPLFFLGTGIFENIEELQNVPDLTFLYRAPRIILEPLDLTEIAFRYEGTLGVSAEEANSLAKLTKGYSFAFQALGHTYWEHMPVQTLSELLPDYDRLLTTASYSKLWKEMSDLDRTVCRAIAEQDGGKVKDIRESLSMKSNLFNAYRMRLKERGIIDTNVYGRISFSLPRFAEFVTTRAALYD